MGGPGSQPMFGPHPTLRFADVVRRKPDNDEFASPGQELSFTYNARAALFQLLRVMPDSQGKTILLPAFHCTTVVEPVLYSGFHPVFYRINKDLSINANDLAAKISNDVSAVLVINYLGFQAAIECVRELQGRHDFYIVEDCAHSFLVCKEGNARLAACRGDMGLYSFYKTVPCFAGGALRINARRFSFHPSSSNVGLKQSVVILKRLLEQVVDNSRDGVLKSTLQSLERRRISRKKRNLPDADDLPGRGDKPRSWRHDLASASMPWFCRSILARSPLTEIAARRRRNYALFDAHLKEHSGLKKLFPVLPEDVCPWAYPVLLADRSAHDHLLRERGVPLFTFGEALHPNVEQCDEDTREDARYLSEHLLLFAVHQNFDPADILGFVRSINSFFEGMEADPQLHPSDRPLNHATRSTA